MMWVLVKSIDIHAAAISKIAAACYVNVYLNRIYIVFNFWIFNFIIK